MANTSENEELLKLQDLALYGVHVTLNGQRIDPAAFNFNYDGATVATKPRNRRERRQARRKARRRP